MRTLKAIGIVGGVSVSAFALAWLLYYRPETLFIPAVCVVVAIAVYGVREQIK